MLKPASQNTQSLVVNSHKSVKSERFRELETNSSLQKKRFKMLTAKENFVFCQKVSNSSVGDYILSLSLEVLISFLPLLYRIKDFISLILSSCSIGGWNCYLLK
ncbi:hypothetical protein CDAR_166571 [Caerostris darwini]|uniref:Uncharacterized protein n=1 Tax=Caerostris darwini TaxID=1538125 RepID=A0AAV4NCM8_9ARAC|nr:hypothetical protein CDAR_166571 [Caerostris darwini]